MNDIAMVFLHAYHDYESLVDEVDNADSSVVPIDHYSGSAVDIEEDNVQNSVMFSGPDQILYESSSQGINELVEFALQIGADVNSKEEIFLKYNCLFENLQDYENNGDGCTALMKACIYGHKQVVQTLLQNDSIKIDEQNNGGKTALFFASKYGHTQIVRLLIENGASINMQCNCGLTALDQATYNGNIDVVKLFLEYDETNINLQDFSGNSLLKSAVISESEEQSKKEIVQLLLQKEANIDLQNNEGLTPLMLAAGSGNKEIVNLLLNNGYAKADTDVQDEEGYTALLYAVESGYEQITRLLLEKDASVNIQTTNGNTALILAANNGYEHIISLLLDSGVPVDVQNDEGYTALSYAAERGYEGIVQLLLEKDASVELKINTNKLYNPNLDWMHLWG